MLPRLCACWPLQPDPLHLFAGQPLLGAVIELGRARALVRRHGLRVFQCAAIGQVVGDPRGAKAVAADRRRDAGRCGPAADR